MSGVGLVSDYNNDSEEISETEDKKAAYEQSGIKEKIKEKVSKKRKDSYEDDRKVKHISDRGESRGSDDKRGDNRKSESRTDDSHKNRGEKSRNAKPLHDKSRNRSRDDRSRHDDKLKSDHKRDDKRYHSDRSRDRRDKRANDPNDRRDKNSSRKAVDKEKEYEEYRKRKYGDSREWGKVSADSLKDVKTDATLPTSFNTTIAKQLAAQREKRKLLWGKKEGEGSTAPEQKGVWGAGSLKNDATGEQTAKFLKLMGVKDVTADNVKDYKMSDDSVLRSSQAVDLMETEYEKSRYLQHVNKGVGLGMVQFSSTQPPT